LCQDKRWKTSFRRTYRSSKEVRIRCLGQAWYDSKRTTAYKQEAESTSRGFGRLSLTTAVKTKVIAGTC
jgi:hypothetical protein